MLVSMNNRRRRSRERKNMDFKSFCLLGLAQCLGCIRYSVKDRRTGSELGPKEGHERHREDQNLKQRMNKKGHGLLMDAPTAVAGPWDEVSEVTSGHGRSRTPQSIHNISHG